MEYVQYTHIFTTREKKGRVFSISKDVLVLVTIGRWWILICMFTACRNDPIWGADVLIEWVETAIHGVYVHRVYVFLHFVYIWYINIYIYSMHIYIMYMYTCFLLTTSPWQKMPWSIIQKSRGFLWRSNFGKPTCCLDGSNDTPRTYYWSYGEEFGGHVSWRLNSLTPKKNGGPKKHVICKWG